MKDLPVLLPFLKDTSVVMYPHRLFKFESVQSNPTFVKGQEKTKGWEGGFFQMPCPLPTLSPLTDDAL